MGIGRRFVPEFFSALVVVALGVMPVSASAGDCRGLLRPLLLEQTPSSAALASVRVHCQEEADAGDAESLYQLALFSLGLAGNWQPDVALPLIRSAANSGVAEAQYWLAWQSEAGPLLPNDPTIALDWYQRAAEGRHRLALQRLAQAYERGELGLAVDTRKALALRAQIRRCADENTQNHT